MNALNNALEWFVRMAFLNMLWLIFSALGLVVIGFFPALVATFTIVRKWLVGEVDIPVFKTFWQTYKKEFIRSNILGYVLTIFGVILYVDILIFNASSNTLINLLSIPLVIVTMVYLLTLFYIFPTFVHYEMKLVQVIKNAFLVMILNPFPTIIMLLGTIGIIFVSLTFQALVPVLSVSLLSLTLMMPSIRAFDKITEKQAKFLIK
ncbi:YesL family protein [Paraliobacillus sediminis]|uniref:YesL family protein n=1 Tax=Paraliobacillus sediminis TaxID=1885916 RepID=UPI000E3D0594|nr:DUF624 domain-containing protein [Paraliobacillus sediminis]